VILKEYFDNKASAHSKELHYYSDNFSKVITVWGIYWLLFMASDLASFV